ncbi:MAG: winged helix DNA-binding domain-containing protein, partial [Geodermatophilaceae bacterium]|nr:winged helix DNA-binding domain-containing protein [Geodermatophilaceae bacterium]
TVCGIHAQVGSAAALSLARRVRDANVGLLTDALWQDRSLVKTYGPRGTVHVVAAQELSLWNAATRALPGQGSQQSAPDGQAVIPTPDQVEELRTAVLSVTHGTALTRAELGAAITAECGPWVDTQASPAWSTGWPHWRLAVDEAVARGALCFGPPQGNRVTFVRADEWLPDTVIQAWTTGDDVLVGEAPAVLLEVARRYLASYGPATHQEFAQWFAMPAGLARKVYAALDDELIAVDVDGYRSWALLDSGPEHWQPVNDCARLLGYFDCFAVGSHPRDEFAPPAAAVRAAAHARAFVRGSARRCLCGPLPVLLVDGVVTGVWTHLRVGGATEQVRVEVFGPTSAGLRRLLKGEVARLSATLDRDLKLSLGPADINAHL